MARVDVSELLHDPDFVDNIQLVKRSSAVDSHGENKITEVIVNSVGSVQPASGRAVQRLPDELRVANVSSFWYQGEIPTSEPGKYTSVLCFKGRRYAVQMVFDWTNFGAGWCEGLCVAEVPAP